MRQLTNTGTAQRSQVTGCCSLQGVSGTWMLVIIARSWKLCLPTACYYVLASFHAFMHDTYESMV